ncbi:MAG TPA: hypothetical protein ENI86_04940 [Acidimicrobiales bacterium]|nr:hypothetical protein [Acidimicrobiales bacterium]
MSAIEPTELFSAYIDGELDPDEIEIVEAHLAERPELRRELDSLLRTRQLVRDLPLLPLPDGFRPIPRSRSPLSPSPTRRRVGVGSLVAGAVATVVVWGLLLGTGPVGEAVVRPDLASVVGSHISVMGEGNSSSSGAEDMPMDPEVITAPEYMDGDFRLMYAEKKGDMAQAMYSDGIRRISLFEQPGRVDWDSMPDDGEMMNIDGATAWHGAIRGYDVLLTERGGMVYVLVGSGNSEPAMEEMTTKMPGADSSVWHRLIGVCEQTVDFFGLG